ncbi:hypothetical protein HCJ66_13860 [Listeria sp. FSL L7-1582]|uniref:hypothetical protein n=1 Tax=Listeria portnoyi TaxID=2713504 RepID=UPI00164E4A1E|nr:hypothetical protein [Listeria portnoyi]MBC6310620.1 hypothetical protein [Listeria portnoyi]
MWHLFIVIVLTITILSIIPMTIIGAQRMKKGQLDNYFVHRMVSDRIWRHIKDKNTVTVLSSKVQRLLFTSYIFSMTGFSLVFIWIIGTDFGNGYLWISFIFLAFMIIAIVFQTLANKTFNLDCSNQSTSE